MSQSTIGIIGGGKRGLEILIQFQNSDAAEVKYVTDIKQDAPAILEARKNGISTYTNINECLQNETDFIFELTGQEEIANLLLAGMTDTRTKIVTHDMASLILQVIRDNEKKTSKSVADEIGEIRTEIDRSLDAIDSLVDNIDDISSQMQMLSLNARIEAARAGDAGKGFAVVAEHMGLSVNSVVEITRQIKQVSHVVEETSTRIEKSIQRLN